MIQTAVRIATGLVIAGSLGGSVQGAAMPQETPTAGRQVPQSQPATTQPLQYQYLLYLPEDYGKEPSRKWPLMLFLHGAGSCGSNLKDVKMHGPPAMVEKGRQFPFIIVSPQSPTGGWSADVLNRLLDRITREYAVDQDCVYCTGLSMGGYGTWSLAMAYPERFAAIVPMSGGGDTAKAARLRHVPAWAFHGGKDSVVPLSQSQGMVDAVNKAGGDAKLTVFHSAKHACWARAYRMPELYEWLLAHRRADAAK
jgi:predicted peptidase